MTGLMSFTLIGLFTGAAYAIAASGLVLTYSTSRVFNMAHGALGMVFAFVYWDLSQRQDLPVWLSLVLVLGVLAPLAGVLVRRIFIKGLTDAPVSVTLVVTVGLMVGLIGIATQVWPPAARSLPQFFSGHLVTLGELTITWHQLLTIALSGVVAAGLYLLLRHTRTGTAMRASVDSPELLQLYGGRPQYASALAWAIGTSLAALSGILLTPVIGLDYYQLTLLVISAYAAAVLGRLTSLPLTFAGAMGLGLAQSYAVGYLPGGGDLSAFRAVVPTLFLFAVIVLLPRAPLRVGRLQGIVSVPVPHSREVLGWGVGLVLLVTVLASVLTGSTLLLVGTAATYAIVMLSLVLLTGYGGYVSLAQFTFAGVGALAYAKLDEPNLLGLVVATLVATAVGALLALPVLRLRGLYLALATLAFAELMDKLVFQASWAFGYNDILSAKRLSVLGVHVDGTGSYTVLMAVFFVLVAAVVLRVRRGRLGRIMLAARDSEAATSMLGLDLRWFRVALFASSAGIAGLAGALYAGLRQSVGAVDFGFFTSLLLLLMAVVWGVTSATGALLGGVFLMYLPVAQSEHQALAGLAFVVLGFGAVALGRDPNGLASRLFVLGRWVSHRTVPMLERRFPGMALDHDLTEEVGDGVPVER